MSLNLTAELMQMALTQQIKNNEKKIPNLLQLKSYDTTFELFMQWFFVSLLVMKDDFSWVPGR